MFSFLISVYKNEKKIFFDEALDSIFKQTFPAKQVVLVCDGPLNEELESIIKKYEAKFKSISIKFDVLRIEVNQGLGNALKNGSVLCTEKYIVRMDSDDISRLERLEMTKNFITNNPGYAVYGAQIQEFNSVVCDIERYRLVPHKHENILRFSKMRNPMNHVTVCIDSDALMRINGYESVIYHEDYYLWIKFITFKFKLINSSDVWVDVRIGNDLVGRRKGISYLKYEIDFIGKCMKLRYFNVSDSMKYLLPRLIVRLMPNCFLKGFYEKLRK